MLETHVEELVRELEADSGGKDKWRRALDARYRVLVDVIPINYGDQYPELVVSSFRNLVQADKVLPSLLGSPAKVSEFTSRELGSIEKSLKYLSDHDIGTDEFEAARIWAENKINALTRDIVYELSKKEGLYVFGDKVRPAVDFAASAGATSEDLADRIFDTAACMVILAELKEARDGVLSRHVGGMTDITIAGNYHRAMNERDDSASEKRVAEYMEACFGGEELIISDSRTPSSFFATRLSSMMGLAEGAEDVKLPRRKMRIPSGSDDRFVRIEDPSIISELAAYMLPELMVESQ